MLRPRSQRTRCAISGARKNVRGPFTIWLRNPALAEHANAFGVALRDSSKLDRRLFELAVITVCRLVGAIRLVVARAGGGGGGRLARRGRRDPRQPQA